MGRITWLLFTAAAFAQLALDPFAGAFAGKDLRLELQSTGNGAYAGAIAIMGQRFPVTARGNGEQLSGQFVSGGTRYPFTATVRGNQFRLVSDGAEYVLVREARVQSIALPAATAHEHPKGFAIQPAAGWRAENNAEGVLLVPAGAVANEEVYVAAIQDGYSPDEEINTVRQLSSAFLQNGAQVRRSAERQTFAGGAAYYWELLDPATRRAVGLKIYFTPAGTRANVLIAYGLVERLAARDADVRQMLGSLRAVAARPAPGGGALADSSPAAQQWLAKLRGKMIRQFHAYSGMSSDKRHMLNADGSYWFKSSSMVSVDVPGASGMSSGRGAHQGRWQIREMGGDVYLMIAYNDGDRGQYKLTADGRNWYMNGEKAFAIDPE
jgi:hypothetical protein